MKWGYFVVKNFRLAAFSKTILIFINAIFISFKPVYGSGTNWHEFVDQMEKDSAVNKALLNQVEQQFQCRNNNKPYGIKIEGNLRLFVTRCGEKSIVGIQQPNQQWTFKNCGATNFTQPPVMPNVPSQYLPEVFSESQQWLSQDYCHIWQVMPISLDEKIRARIIQETGCHSIDFLFRNGSSSLIDGKIQTQQSELMKVRCPGDIIKVIYQNDPNGPLQIHICHSKTETVCFKDSDGLDFCTGIACYGYGNSEQSFGR
jgi:hypothetical protein